MVTTQDLSSHLKSTVRNANRILKNLEKGFFNSGGYILQFEEGSDSKIIN